MPALALARSTHHVYAYTGIDSVTRDTHDVLYCYKCSACEVSLMILSIHTVYAARVGRLMFVPHCTQASRDTRSTTRRTAHRVQRCASPRGWQLTTPDNSRHRHSLLKKSKCANADLSSTAVAEQLLSGLLLFFCTRARGFLICAHGTSVMYLDICTPKGSL